MKPRTLPLRTAHNLRLHANRLAVPVTDTSEYESLFRILQPVAPIHFTRPGDPPSLTPRATFDDIALNDQLRSQGTIVKGRFAGGSVAYVYDDEFELYAHAFCRPVAAYNEVQIAILDALRTCGPITPQQIKAETGYLIKEISPALNRLQCACVIFEEQYDSEWERPFGLMDDVRPNFAFDPSARDESIRTVPGRCIEAHGVATRTQLKDWSRLPAKLIQTATDELVREGVSEEIEIEGVGPAFWHSTAPERLESSGESIFMIHKADPLARLEADLLKSRFGSCETLQYLLIDGDFAGAVVGHWRIGPHDVDDIMLLLPEDECQRRLDEVIEVVSQKYHPPHSRILKFCGEEI